MHNEQLPPTSIYPSAGQRHNKGADAPVTAVFGHALAPSSSAEPGTLPDLGGSYSTTVAGTNHVVARADMSGQFPLYYRKADEGLHMSSEAAAVAGLTARPDAVSLTAFIALPALTDLHGGRSAYEGVSRLEPGHTLTYNGRDVRIDAGRATPELTGTTIEEAAGLLREALLAGVRARTVGRTAIGADFSGGLDSTSLAYMATMYADRVAAFTEYDLRYPTGDEQQVRRLLRLPQSKRLDWQPLPLTYDTQPEHWWADYDSDEPNPGALESTKSDAFFRAVKAAGVDLHIAGDGGDEIATVGVERLADLARQRHMAPLWRAARDTARLRHKSPLALMWQAAAAARHDQRTLLQDAVKKDLWTSTLSSQRAVAGRWLTPQARHALTELVDDRAAEIVANESFDFANHTALSALRTGGRMRSHLIRRAARQGVETHAPYMDDAVLRAAFAIAGHERVRPGVFKQIFQLALDGLVPPDVLQRQTKGNYTGLYYDQLRAHAKELEALFTNSRLADLGIIEPAAVRRTIADIMRGDTLPGISFDMLVASEMWLRGRDAPPNTWHPLPPVASPPANARPAAAPVQNSGSPVALDACYRMPSVLRAASLGPQEGAALLDTHSGERYNLPASLTAVLDVVSRSASLAKAVELLQPQVPGTDPNAVAQYVRRSVELLMADGLLCKGTEGAAFRDHLQPPRAEIAADHEQTVVRSTERLHKPSPIDYAAALGGLVSAVILTKYLPFHMSPAAVRMAKRRAHIAPADTADAARLLTAVHRLGELYPGKLACYELSVAGALATALRRKQVAVVMGAATKPIRYHAWIEAGQTPVTMPADDNPQQYQPLYRF